MIAMICIDLPYYNIAGRAIKITINTLSNELCEKIKQVILSSRPRDVSEIIKSLGGCVIESENPLKITSDDKSLEIVVEPASLFSKMYWSDVARRVRDIICGST